MCVFFFTSVERGKMVDFVSNAALVQKFPDQFSPLRCFGCDLSSEFNGTLFRFPLRTEEQAATSRISNRAHLPAAAAALFRDFTAGSLCTLRAVTTKSQLHR
jgi:sacsin